MCKSIEEDTDPIVFCAWEHVKGTVLCCFRCQVEPQAALKVFQFRLPLQPGSGCAGAGQLCGLQPRGSADQLVRECL